MREVSEVVVVVGPSDEDGYCHVEITHPTGETDHHFVRRDQVDGFVSRELDCLDRQPISEHDSYWSTEAPPFNDSYHAL